MSELDNIGKLPIERQIDRLGTAVRAKSTSGGWIPTENQIEIANRAEVLLLSIPGHAEYFRDRILTAQAAHRDDLKSLEAGLKFNRYASEVGSSMETLSHLPSVETVRVLGELLSNEWVNPNNLNRKKEECYGPVCFPAVKALSMLPLVSKPAGTKTDADARRDIESWRLWYLQIKEGKRTFRFEGDPTEYDLNGPAPKEKQTRIALGRKRDGERQVRQHTTRPKSGSLAKTTSELVSKPGNLAAILASLLVLVSLVWYGLRNRRT